MSIKEFNGKEETSQEKHITSSPIFDENEKKPSANSTCSAFSVRSVSTEKRKLKSDHTDILYCNKNRRSDLKRLNTETDIPRKKKKISSLSQGHLKLPEASYSNNNQITSWSSSNGAKRDVKLKDIRLTNVGSKIDYGIKSLNSSKIAKDMKSKAEGQAKEKTWPHLLIHKDKMKELKKESNNKFKDSSEECVLEKCKKFQFFHNYHSKEITKEPFESRRRKIGFKIPIKSYNTLQKLVEENVFSSESSKPKTKQEEKECLKSCQVSLNMNRCKTQPLFSDSTYKQTVREWKRKYHEHQESNDSNSKENLAQKPGTTCSPVSLESTQDTDQEMQIVEELHAARVGKSVDLPVVPSSGDLMSMEIDLVEDDVHPSTGISSNNTSDKKLLIVIDTNILMNHLKFVRVLKTTEITGFESLVLIIPWVVVQELDRMKVGKLLKHAQHKAIPAIHFINDSLKNQDTRLWGQSLQLAAQILYGFSDENNDDRVLKCCLQYQELFPCSLVILCTDDRNLRSKGLISGVKSLSKEELSAELLNISLNTVMCHQPCISNQPLKTALPVAVSPEEESTSPALSVQLEHILCELEKCFGAALTSILETEMKIAFGDLWTEMLYVKPPWTVIGLLQCFKKHWLAVFGLVMEKKLLLTIDSLYENFSKANKAVDFATVKFLLLDSKSLLHAFSTRSNYDGILPQTFAKVNKLLQVFAEVKTKLKPNSSESTVSKKQEDTTFMNIHSPEVNVFLDTHLVQLTRHQEIWSVLENVWTTIYQNSTDVFQRLGQSSALTTSKIASFEEAFLCLQKLMAAVKDILQGIQRILAPNSTYQDVETLYNFLIKYEVNKNVKFTAQELYDCVSHTDYREKLTIGCHQLIEMEHTMQQCNASVYMEAKNRGWRDDTFNSRT
uniref:transcriptional protein SWT1 isoform X2 n=1 Tax=Jaculus jaculus TaxID=51337 RepID=UPI001E1B5C37|nr:transcriptional protein SWT1 isoform X2 [Jaculus jaculus]